MSLSRHDEKIDSMVYSVTSRYGVPADSPDSRPLIDEILQSYDGEYEIKAIRKWFTKRIKEVFICLNKYPKWIQDNAWAFSNGKPMIFVGQVDITIENKIYFHDDTNFYLFMAQDTSQEEFSIIVQQF